MTNLLQASRVARRHDGLHTFQGNQYWGVALPSMKGNEESIAANFAELIAKAYNASSVIYACELSRISVFAEAGFQFRPLGDRQPAKLFGTTELAVLERPWPGGTTGDLLARMLLDADFGGSAFVARPFERRDRLMRMRPDWVSIVMGSDDDPDEANFAMDADFLGVMYHPGGRYSGRDPVPLLADEVAHFAPDPDPLAAYRGRGWVSRIIPELESDAAATAHKAMFFRNGATPQVIVTMAPGVSPQNLDRFATKMDDFHAGWENAYKTLFVGNATNATVVGRDLQQLDFRATQGAGEVRIAIAAGVHPVIVGMSEGLAGSSLNQGNFNSARRLVADRTMRPLWRSMVGALSSIVEAPPGAQLWYDDRDIAFLREDRKDAAEIEFLKAQTIKQLVEAGYEPESVVRAVMAGDMTALRHTGVPSVQLQTGKALTTSAAAGNAVNGSANGSVNGTPVGVGS